MIQKDAVEQASARIERRDAEVLLQHVLHKNRAWLLAHPETELSEQERRTFFALVERRALQEPLQYLTGVQEFHGLDIQVGPEVLIPRPETELLVEAVVEWVQRQPRFAAGEGPRLVDVGTGSGAIAIALAAQLPGAEIQAFDLSEAALTRARANAKRLGFGERIEFAISDLLSAAEPQIKAGTLFDVVISNPPYVPASDAESLQPEVRDFEPHLALFAGGDGLEVYRRLIPQTMTALRPGGLLAMEFGYGQTLALRELLADWNGTQFLKDYAGIPRMALAERP